MNFKEVISNDIGLKSGKLFAEFIEKDSSVGGILDYIDPQGAPILNEEKFISKYCSWWDLAKILFQIAKIFTGEVGDKRIDDIIILGDQVCNG